MLETCARLFSSPLEPFAPSILLFTSIRLVSLPRLTARLASLPRLDAPMEKERMNASLWHYVRDNMKLNHTTEVGWLTQHKTYVGGVTQRSIWSWIQSNRELTRAYPLGLFSSRQTKIEIENMCWVRVRYKYNIGVRYIYNITRRTYCQKYQSSRYPLVHQYPRRLHR